MDDRESRLTLLLLLVVSFAIALSVGVGVVTGILSALSPGIGRAREMLGFVAVASGLAWLGMVAVLRIIRSPARPRPGPTVQDLPPEPAPVANMLVNGFRPTREAMPAAVFDLAPRGVLEIEQRATDAFAVRLREPVRGPLTDYEMAVVHLIRQKASEGVVDAAALTTGPRTWASGWWSSFRGAIEREARRLGLSRDLWDRSAIAALFLGGLVPVVLATIAAAHLGAGVLSAMTVVLVIAGLRRRGRQRETPAGLQAASAWLGVRRYLREAGSFEDLPPAAVTVWERYLACAAALGAAEAAVRAIPMGADRDLSS